MYDVELRELIDETNDKISRLEVMNRHSPSTPSGVGQRANMAPEHGKPCMKPPHFDGSDSWHDYKVQFEIIAKLNAWDYSMKAMYLATCLKGQALSVFGDLDERARYDYNALTTALNRRFGSENREELNKTLLKSRQRKKGESLPELAQSIKRLTRYAYPDAPWEVQDSLAKDKFLEAFEDPDLRWKIFQSRAKTLDEALHIALECEAFKMAETKRLNGSNLPVRSVETTDKMNDEGQKLQSSPETSSDLHQILGESARETEGPTN